MLNKRRFTSWAADTNSRKHCQGPQQRLAQCTARTLCGPLNFEVTSIEGKIRTKTVNTREEGDQAHKSFQQGRLPKQNVNRGFGSLLQGLIANAERGLHSSMFSGPWSPPPRRFPGLEAEWISVLLMWLPGPSVTVGSKWGKGSKPFLAESCLKNGIGTDCWR